MELLCMHGTSSIVPAQPTHQDKTTVEVDMSLPLSAVT